MDIIEYYLKYDHEEMCLGSIVLENNEDEDDAFPRFLQESYCPLKDFSKVFKKYYSTAQSLIKNIIDSYTNNSPGESLEIPIEADIELLQCLLEELIKDGFFLNAFNTKTRIEYILAFYDIHDPYRLHGRETTLKFLGCNFVPAH